MREPLVVIGASYAGLQTALSARAAGYAGEIVLIGDEDTLPYQRPPLSKAYMLGKVEERTLPIRPQSVLDSNHIALIADTRVTGIDRRAKTVSLSDGRTLAYHKLALTTGCRVRRLNAPGCDAAGVHYLRTLDDARRLREAAPAIQHAVIIGGGFIGLEVAASLASLGKQVTVVETQDRLLVRAVPAIVSSFLADVHRDAGVTILTGASVRCCHENHGRVSAVELNDGTRLPAELVVVGIGAIANAELAQDAGLECNDGIAVDEFARTSDPDIVAAGDCTRFPSALAGRAIRLESVQNATDQARTAGNTLAGVLAAYEPVPWFWSDQYDLKLQMVGLAQGHDRAAMRGDPAERKFSLFYFRDGALVGVDSVNRAGDHMAGRSLIGATMGPTPEQIEDESFDLTDMVKTLRAARAPHAAR